MRYVNGILVFTMVMVALAMKHQLPALWTWSAFALLLFMWFVGLNDRQKLPEEKRRRLKGGFVPGITSSFSDLSAQIFCTLMIWWLAGVLGWVLLHGFSHAPNPAN